MIRGWGGEEVLHFKPAKGGVVIQKKKRKKENGVHSLSPISTPQNKRNGG